MWPESNQRQPERMCQQRKIFWSESVAHSNLQLSSCRWRCSLWTECLRVEIKTETGSESGCPRGDACLLWNVLNARKRSNYFHELIKKIELGIFESSKVQCNKIHKPSRAYSILMFLMTLMSHRVSSNELQKEWQVVLWWCCHFLIPNRRPRLIPDGDDFVTETMIEVPKLAFGEISSLASFRLLDSHRKRDGRMMSVSVMPSSATGKDTTSISLWQQNAELAMLQAWLKNGLKTKIRKFYLILRINKTICIVK